MIASRAYIQQVPPQFCVHHFGTMWSTKRKALPNPNLQQVSTSTKVHVIATTPAGITQLSIQPGKNRRTPTVAMNVIPILSQKWKNHPRHGVSSCIWQQASGHNVPHPNTSVPLYNNVSSSLGAYGEVLPQPCRVHTGGLL